jgi:peptidoglycan/xylan/chitin deacetylase (PgdA/CDA1 family)
VAPSVWRGTSGRQSIALTFDDGPSESTPKLLEALAEFGVKATFFECGVNVRRLPGVARRVAAAGHEVGNHTETHARLWLRSAGFIRGEIEAAQRTIEDATGVTPRLFRAPYGVRWFGLGRAQRDLGLTGVMWSVLGLDWKLPAEAVAARLAKRVRPGAIVCLHDGRETAEAPDVSVTIEAIRRVAPQWIRRGLKFETVSQILCPAI